jgi:hypothetical protein
MPIVVVVGSVIATVVNLLIRPVRRVQYTETLMNSQPFQGYEGSCGAYQGKDQRAGLGEARRRLVENQGGEAQDDDPSGCEEGRAENGDMPEVVPRQWEVTEAKLNLPTLMAGATVDPNEV